MPENKAGRPYVKGPNPINIGSITTSPDTTGFPGLRTGRALTQEDRINMYEKQIDPNIIRPGKTRLSDVAGDLTGRYDEVVYGGNNEDAWGAQQSVLSKGVNGILKGTNLAATTVVGGFGTLGGAVSAMFTGRLADIWDNPVMQGIDEWNEKVDQEYLPNYYTDQEKNAEWYSTDNWMTANFLFDKVIKNSGFAVGAVVSGNIAGRALGLAGTAMGEAAAGRAAIMETSQTFKAFAPMMKSTARAFSVGKNAEAAAILEKEITSIADIAERTSKLAKIAKETNQFAKINDVGKRIGVAAYSQSGEAAFEGIQTSNEFRGQLIEQFKRDNFGVAPDQEQLKKINQQTEKVGKASFLTNMTLLAATEYVQLPKLLGSSYAAERQAANSLAGIADDVVLKNGKYVAREAATTKFGKLYNKAKGVGKYVFDPKEMGQEIGQYAIQIGTQNYYNKAYKGEDANVLVDGALFGLYGTDEYGEGIGALNSKEGIEGGIIGGLTGGLMQAKANYKMGKALKTNTTEFLKDLNNAPTYKEAVQYKLDAVNRGVALQEEQEEAIKQGEKLEAKDLNADMMHNYLAPRIKYGRMDMVMDDISDMRKDSMSDEGMASLKQLGLANANDTSATFNARLSKFEETAKNTEQIFKSTNLRYSGEILKDDEGKPILNEKGEQQRKYSDQVIDQMIYAASKVADYDIRIPEVSMLPLTKGIDVQSVLNNELTDPNSNVLAEALIQMELSSEIDAADVKQDLVDIVELSLRRKEYLKEYNDLIANPSKYVQERQEFVSTEETPGVAKETISINTKRGLKNIEIGTEYFLGKVVDKSKEGKDVYRAPRIVVLGKNEDGTIKVQDSDGKVYDVKESTLERYNLGKVESTLKNKKAKFYMEHWNMVYNFNFGKDKGGKQKGRIEYDPEDDVMLFIYKNKKGEIKEIEVTGDQFKLTEAAKKKGFTEPMITEVGTLTAVQQKAKDEYTDEVDSRLEAKREARLKILNDLFDDLSNSQDKSKKLVEQKQKALESITKELEALKDQIEQNAKVDNRFKKGIKFNTVTKKALENAMRLARMQEQLENEIEVLESDLDDIEFNINYISDLVDNIDDTATNFYEFKKDLEDQVLNLEVLREQTAKQITIVSKLLSQAQKAFDFIINMLSDFIQKFESKYPNVPRLMGQEWVDFLQNNPNFLKLKPNYKDELQDLNDLIALHEDGDITPSEKRIEDLKEHLDIMQEEFKDLSREIEAKYLILNKFSDIAEQYQRQEAESKQMQRNVTLGQELLGTLTNSVQNFFGTKTYEPEAKKDKFSVVGGTKPTTEDSEERPLPGYAARVNHFGARVSDMDNVDDLKGVIVTANTEDQILSGLVDNFLNEDVRPLTPARREEIKKEVIFLVVTENGQLVDKNGKLIPGKSAEETQEEYNKRLYDNAIFQVFPSASLTSKIKQKDGSEKIVSMFRDGTPDYVMASLKAQYKAWRDTELANVKLDKKGQKFKTSFGNLEFVKVWDDAKKEFVTDTATRTSAQDAGLLEKGILNRDSVITIATNSDDKSEGSVSFKSPKGRVFLRVPGQGLVRLQNKKFSKEEAETIFDAILNLAKNASQTGSLYGGEKEEVNKAILSWLKSVVYWGIAKNADGTRKPAGYNNIWFEDVMINGKPVKKLLISGLQKEYEKYFDFTPQGLINSKQDIIGLLGQMYANTDAKKVNIDAFNAPYDEILRFDSLGNPVTRTWPNYQTYLLSANIIDNKGVVTGKRTSKEIPLTTQVRPLTSPEDTNRKGIYFTLNSSVEYTIPAAPVAAPVAVVTPVPVAPAPAAATPTAQAPAQAPTAAPVATPAVTPQQQPSVPGQFNLNGEAENTRMFGNGVGIVRFTFSSAKAIEYITSLSENIFAIQGLLSANITEAFVKNDIIDINQDDVKLRIGQIKENLRDTNPDASDEELTGKALNIAVSMIWKDVAPQVVAAMTPVQPAIADEAPVVETPVVEEAPVVKETRMKDVGLPQQELQTRGTTNQEGIDWDTATVENIKERLISGEIKEITDNFEEPGDTVKFSFYQEEDRQSQQMVGGVEDFAEVDIVEEPKGNYFSAENGFGEGATFYENDPKLDKLINKIIDYNKTAKVEEAAPVVEEEAPVAQAEDLPEDFINLDDIDDVDIDRSEMRVAQAIDKLNQFKPEQWAKVEEAISRMLPQIPFYRVKNIIKGTNGRQLWGMFHEAAVYVYEGAEEGTAYHEVFEAVWKMFAGPAEKQAIINEFKSRRGSFVDRESRKTIDYIDATPYQIKEQLAEEFREAVLFNKLGIPLESKSLIGRLFSQLIDFIKSFFTGRNAQRNTKELFNKIGNGYYAQFNPYESQLSYAKKGIIDIENAQANRTSEGRSTTIPEIEMHDIIQHMTFLTLNKLSLNNESVFTVSNQDEKVLYPYLKLSILKLLAGQKKLNNAIGAEGKVTLEKVTRMNNNIDTLSVNIQKEWNDIIADHKAHLKTFDVQFDENDNDALNDENNSGRADYQKADKIDTFRKSNAALQLVLSTLPVTETVSSGKPEWVRSSIGGVILMPAAQAHIDLTNRLHDSVDLEDMFFGLKTMAEGNPNYESLFRRMTGNSTTVGLDLNTIKEHDWQLMTAFWKSISKQNADVITVFIQDNGDVVVSNSTLSSAAKQAKKEMITDMISTLKADQSKYFRYAPAPIGKYYAKENLKALTFDGKDLKQYVDFLSQLGIDFNIRDLQDLKESQLTQFKEATQFIKAELSKIGNKVIVKDEQGNDVEEDTAISTINTKSMNIDGDLFRLAIIKSIIDDTEFQSTYFNINGERTQSYIGRNVVSALHNAVSQVKNIEELANNPKYKQYSYLTGGNDVFAQGSQILKKLFDIVGPDSTGKRNKGTEDILKPVLVDGIVDEQTGKKKESSKLTYRQRVIQSINLNLDGVYDNLVPGDAALEHAIRMHNAKDPFVKEENLFNKNYLEIFQDYFISEVELAKENRNTVSGKGKDLRFFKAILGDTLHDKIMKGVNSKTDSQELYNYNKQEIDSAVEQFIKEETEDVEDLLRTYDIVRTEEGLIKVDKIALAKEGEILTQAGLTMKLKALSINYMIANIEMHKLIYSDPYQYNDELKRIKNFNSPGQDLVPSSQEVNSTLDRLYNKGFKKGDLGWTDMIKDHFRSVTLSDVFSTNENLGYDKAYEETDGEGYITIKGVRVFKLRDGSWTSANERQYRFDIAFEELVKSGASKKEIDKFLKGNPKVKDTYTPIKPIVRGNKDNGRTYNDIVLHKFALVPLSFRVLYEINPSSNAIKLYNKMQNENIDYAVYESGSKVGTEKVSPLYDKDGNFDETPFQDAAELKGGLKDNVKRAVSKIPFSIVAVQSEVPSKDTPEVTQGSQITKLATMDYLQSGVPVDFMPGLPTFEERFSKWLELDDKSSYNGGDNIYNEIKNNQELLEARLDDAVNTLYKKLGIKETTNADGKKGFVIADKEKLIKTLKEEIGKREINYNITDALDGFIKGDVVLEATPIYQQVRNILYSIADKTIVRPKINGGLKVQVTSALLESQRAKAEPVLDKDGNPAFNKDGSPKIAYASNELAFYKNEDGKRVCEIMLGRWFKSNKTDAELMDYFNNDPVGKKEFAALMGVAFRIPTQKQNSIDVFRIAKFLPEDFGDSVIIPSALVKKAGSDFDIDKLSIYLKSLYEDGKGYLKVIPFLGYGQQAKDRFGEIYEKDIKDQLDKLIKSENFREDIFDLANALDNDDILTATQQKFYDDNSKVINLIKEQAEANETSFSGYMLDQIVAVGAKEKKLNEKLLNQNLKDQYMDTMYKKSLENAYITSLENLISNPLNYDNLVKPNDAKPLKDLSDDIQKEMGYEKGEFGGVRNMLSRRFMSNLRHSFVTGKDAIGIAAQGQVGHAQRQRSVVYVDTDRLEGDLIDDTDKTILGNDPDSELFATDTDINFEEYNSAIVNGKRRPMLSWIKNKAGEYISDINGMFIDGYVDISKGDWIMKLGATPNTASTWLFLADLGVPIKTVGYFMNQPIIRDYLRAIENKGYSWLYIDDIISDKLDDYAPSNSFTESGASVKGIPSEKKLFEMLKYNKKAPKNDMSDLQKLQQQYMLKEFLKYAKMSSHMFDVSRATNYDTANINDPYLVFKKIIQLAKARRSIISSVDDIIAGSFIKELKDKIFDYRDAFSEILMSDYGNVRTLLEDVLEPYTELSDRDFVKLSQKAVNDLFDWAVQTTSKTGVPVNSKVARILLGTETEKSAAEQIVDYKDSILGNPGKGIQPKPDHPLFNNIILKSLSVSQDERHGGKKGKVINLEIDGRDNKVADQNLTIYGFNELREVLRAEDNLKLYGKFTRLALLQSGLTNSPISFTNLLPYNDFKGLYNDTLSILEKLPNLAEFKKLNVLERGNWNNSEVSKYKRATLYFGKKEDGTTYVSNLDIDTLIRPLKDAVKNNVIPKLVGLSPMSEAGRSDFIVYSYEDYISNEKRILRRKTNNTEHQHKMLMQKVYTIENNKRVPLMHITEKENKRGELVIYKKYVYKAINAWGDSFRAQEFYTTNQQSVLDNGFDKVANEVEDDVIVNIYKGGGVTSTGAVATTPTETVSEKAKVDNSTLKDGDVVYDKLGTKFIFRGLRQADQTGAGSPRLERTDGTGEIAIPGSNIELFKESITKPDGVPQEQWDASTPEEKAEMIRQQKEC